MELKALSTKVLEISTNRSREDNMLEYCLSCKMNNHDDSVAEKMRVATSILLLARSWGD